MAYLDRLLEIASTDGAQLAIAGIAGGVVRVLSLQETFRRGLGSVAVGGIMAFFVGPIAIPLMETVVGVLSIDSERAATVSGFVTGLGGITFAQTILYIIDKIGKKDGEANV